ncbi:hypothetical protein, partial [Aggregatibacter kilianii]
MKIKATLPYKVRSIFWIFLHKKTVKNVTALCIAILSSVISKFQPNKKAYHSIRLFNWVSYQLFDNFSYHTGAYCTAT